jgi:alpha-1,3-rhamnosyl/mannosyltransferase
MYPFFWKLPAKYTVVFVHGAGDVAPGKPFVFSREILNKILIFFRRRINIAIAGSDFARKEIIKYYHFDPSQVRVVNNGVDESFIPASPNIIAETVKKYKLPRKYFLGVGRLIPVKNVLRSLEAFEEFCKETGNTEMYFVNIGARGSERPAIDAFLAASPYKDRIMLIDYVDQTDLPVMYSDAYALVFPLLNEGFGLPAIEAMACGIPAVISETAAPEITNDDAVLVDAEDMHDIARAMRALVEDSAFYERIKKAGQTKAATFTWKANGDKVIAIYEELMSGINTKK